MARPRRSLAERFASKVNPTPTERGCLLWTGFVDPEGRGRINSGGAKGWPIVASRAAWMLAHGEIPDNQCICHRCDNPLCVNIEHLFLGTQLENIADRESKGRTRQGRVERRSGEGHGCAKLTWAQVCEIRASYAAGGVSQRSLGQRFGVTHITIGCIVRGKRWTGPGELS